MVEMNLLPEELRHTPPPRKTTPVAEPVTLHQPAAEPSRSAPTPQPPTPTPKAPKPPVEGWWQRWRRRRTQARAAAPRPPQKTPPSHSVPAEPAPAPVPAADTVIVATHQPAKGHPDSLSVDLATDRSLRFSAAELGYRARVGAVMTLFTVIFLALISIGIHQIQAPVSDESELQQQITTLQNRLAEFQAVQKDIVAFDHRLAAINQLLDRHLLWSRLFTLLEQATLPEVSYRQVSFDATGRVTLSAVAKNYPAVAQQIAVWEAQSESVASVSFTGAHRAANQSADGEPLTLADQVSFELVLQLTPSFLTAE